VTLRCVLAVDPGKTTGYAWHRIGDPAPVIVDEAPFETFVPWAEDRLKAAGREALVIVERYVITPATLRMSRQTDALETIGAVRYLVDKYGADLVWQNASTAKNIVPNSRLRTLGWYTVGKDHGRDATRHLAVWLHRAGLLTLPPLPDPEDPDGPPAPLRAV
jgi:hypothetical protein